MSNLCDKLDGVQQEVGQEIQKDYKQLKNDIKQQKFIKGKLMKTVNTLLKETTEQQLKSQNCDQRIVDMELTIGMIEHT